jgi:uncharacterized membrane protein
MLALKTLSLVVFPTYAEYVNFCLGFMVVDLPWLNNLLPSLMTNEFDTTPTGYLFYFTNMNFAAMHFFTFLIFLGLLIISYFLLVDTKASEIKIDEKSKAVVNVRFKAVKEFYLNFFCFGLAFAGFSSVIGAFLNYSSVLTLNGVFYIVGVIVYGAILSEACVGVIMSHRLCRLRVVLKATFLAGAGLNPLYLAAVAMIVDGLLMGVEYTLRQKQLVCPRSWLASNIFILVALVSYYFIPDSYLTLGIVSVFVVLALVFEIYQFCCEKEIEQSKHIEMFEEEQNLAVGHFWNLEPQEHKNNSELDLSEKMNPQKETPNKGDYVFEVSKIDDEPINVTQASGFSTNPF